ncbi:MAG: hypothetical protein ACFUZC_11695 [Chthoniobacteraceae bacterium]
MTWGLIEKELRQHAWVLLSLVLLLLADLFLGIRIPWMQRASGSPFAALRFFLVFFVPLGSLILGQVLVVGEYRNKTQLFLEGLPLPRWRMIAVKYGIGLAAMLLAVALALAVACWRSKADALTPRFLFLLALRSGCYAWFLWSLCFAHGFTGRYRVILAMIALFLIQQNIVIAQIDFGAIGPFELIGAPFAYERYEIPFIPIGVTVGYALFWTACAFGLGLARDATLAMALAQRMSSREKIILTFVAVAALMVAVEYSEKNKEPDPVLLPGAVDVTSGCVQVSASAAVAQPTEEENVALDRMAHRAAYELEEVARYLGCRKMPPVFIIHRRDFKPGVIEEGDIKMSQGVMVRANLTAKDFDMEAFRRTLLYNTLSIRSFKRLTLERNAWVLDGFAAWWTTRKDAIGHDAEELRRACEAMPEHFSEADLGRWLTLRKTTGKEATQALAAAGLRTLRATYGDKACREFLGSVLGVEVTEDPRSWLYDVAHPVALRFKKATGKPLGTVVGEWREAVLRQATTATGEARP